MKRKAFLVSLICLALLASSVFVLSAYAETWTQVNTDGFGDANNWQTWPLSVFNGYLYAGTYNNVSGGEIWRTSDSTNWTKISLSGFGDLNIKGIWPVAVFNGYLYAGTDNSTNGAEIWRSSDGTNWTQASSFGDPNVVGAAARIVFDNYLYAGSYEVATGAKIWRTSNGITWTQVNTDGFGDPNNQTAAPVEIFKGYLYAGTLNPVTGGELWRTSNGTDWAEVIVGFNKPINDFVSSIRVFNGELYIGTQNPTGGEIWRSSDGANWTQVVSGGFGDANNGIGGGGGLFVSNDYLYAGTRNDITGCELWRTSDGTNWIQVNTDGFGDANNPVVRHMITFSGKLYMGTRNNFTGGEIWALSYDNTSTGSNVNVDLGSEVDLTFDTVSSDGSTAVATSNTPPADTPQGFEFLGTYFDISTDVSYSGPIQVTISYDESSVPGNEEDLRLFHWNGTAWEDVTVSADTVNNTIIGEVTSLSPFALGAPSPPTGVNTYLLIILGLLAVAAGFVVIRKIKVLRV